MSNLRGALESISLTDVAQLLHVNRKTGMLQVSSGKISGVLYFSSGEVIHAETLSARGEVAAFEILEWTCSWIPRVFTTAGSACIRSSPA